MFSATDITDRLRIPTPSKVMFTRPPDGFDAMASGPIPEGILQISGCMATGNRGLLP